jgi:predicted dehydrogenase
VAKKKSDQEYGLARQVNGGRMAAPKLPYRPPKPKRYRPTIGLIGCGGITEQHLNAYVAMGYDVVALCDVVRNRALKRRRQFYPKAHVTADYRDVLKRSDIDVVDIAPHPEERAPIIEAALKAGKHVLSQKPFVVDLDVGKRLVDLADKKSVKLAVNQNGRWAPHFSYMRHAMDAGLIGDVASVDFTLHWDHSWVKNTVFNSIHHLILYDFAIHWFDMATTFFGGQMANRVFASIHHAPGQTPDPPLLAHAVADFDNGQATFVFNANCTYGQEDRTCVLGSRGTLRSVGPSLSDQSVMLTTKQGSARPRLQGTWFPQGFEGAMGELLCAIEEDREPSHSARNNLASIALCFAATASADRGKPMTPGRVKTLSS